MQKVIIAFISALLMLTPIAFAHESSIKAEDLQSLADQEQLKKGWIAREALLRSGLDKAI